MALVSHYSRTFGSAGSENNFRVWTQSTAGDEPPGKKWTRFATGGYLNGPYIEANIQSAIDRLWWDMNHQSPGTGPLNLVLPLYFGTEIPTLNNLLGCQFRARMRVVDFWLPKTAKLGFWLQGTEKSSNLYYNYRNRRQTISQQLGWGNRNMEDRAKVEGVKDSGWRDIVIDFDGDGAWQCMGSRPERDQVTRPGTTEIDSSIVYGCAPNFPAWLADSASDKVDLGIFVFFENTPNPSVPPTAVDYVDGKIQLDSVSLWKPA